MQVPLADLTRSGDSVRGKAPVDSALRTRGRWLSPREGSGEARRRSLR